MDKRMVEFIRALRAAGIRISVAESQDALRGAGEVGIGSADIFRAALKSALVKENRDGQTFDYFFPLFFNHNQPPLEDIMQQLSPEEQQLLQQAMQALMGDSQALRQLMERLLAGRPFTEEELRQMGQESGLENGDAMYQRGWFERRMMAQSGLAALQRLLDDLLQQLADMGMSQEQLDQLAQTIQQNMAGLSEQLSNYAGASLAERMARQEPPERPDLLDVPLQRLSDSDLDAMRDEIRRLAARLRTRAALRQKRAKLGDFDPRRTLRANMRYGGVPIELQHRNKHKKPSLVLICDLSTSMRHTVEFMLTLVYELQDQVRRTHSFIFISDMVDVTMIFEQADCRAAIAQVMAENPPGYYSTDLGNSLKTFASSHMATIDSRTTVIVCGDGRNNYNNPRLDIISDMQRKARRLFWFCPEPQYQWGTGDSDMHHYAMHADGVFLVRNLRELAHAVDRILVEN